MTEFFTRAPGRRPNGSAAPLTASPLTAAPVAVDRPGMARRTVLAAGAALIALLALAGPAWAQSLDQAKASGLVGERPDGLLGIVQNQAGVQALVDRVNAERMEAYRRIAGENNLSMEVVQARAGARLIERVAAGEYYMTPQGNWVRR